MNDTCICENTPTVWRLTGVTRTLRLRIFNPDGTPLDLTGRTVAVTIARDNSEFSYAPGFVIEGDDNNVVKFEWPANKQGAGDYTINVTTTDGSGNVDRVNWHGPTGIRLVDFSFMVRGEDALGVTSEANIGLDGTFTMNGTGMSAYDEWLAEGHTGTPEEFIAWLRQPDTDAASAAEAQMGQIQERADADHTRAGNDHTTAGQDHTRAGNDHTTAASDHGTAADDHTLAVSDHGTAADDHTTAGNDHTRAQADHGIAADDHTTAAADHQTASDDHTQAGSDHTRAGEDHTRAGDDHQTASSDHTRAGEDHTTAGGDHTRAGEDHTQAGNDHTRAEADHGIAADDHTQATADHAVMAGYDTRLGNVEDEVSQLGQDVADKYTKPEGGIPASDMASGVIPTVPAISTDIPADRESDAKTASPKAVADALGKWGVVSQRQIWNGNTDSGWDYTMRDMVYGIIPQEFINRATSHPQIIFNENTGYFELNGLTDISYKEMEVIVEDFAITMGLMGGNNGIGALTHGRTLIPDNTGGTISLSYAFYNRQTLEAIVFGWSSRSTQTASVISSMCRGNYRLKTIEALSLSATTAANVDNAFLNCYSLENARIKSVRIDLNFSQSSRLSLASVVYMVDNAYANSTFTLTLHATAYARCLADTTEYTYSGQTYTGILAYASVKNITIASA